MYEAIDISFGSGGKQILKNVGVRIKPGKLCTVVGPNGAGKSSLIKIMSNELTDYSGNVVINAAPIKSYKPKELSRIRSVMAQSSSLQFAFTAREVVALSRHGHITTRKENQDIVNEVMDLADIQPFADQNYLTLSGGEKQRVQLARVLAQVWEEAIYPRYILLDEPTSSMDIAQQQAMLGIVRKIRSRNIGVLAIVHDLNLAAQFSDEIYMMRSGEVVGAGAPREVFTKSNIEKTFCCKVTIYNDPCNNCPFIIPDSVPSPSKIAITK